jgi:hypothetical protein
VYRCHACLAVVEPRIARRLHIVYRTVREPWKDPRQEIAREYPVCRQCQEMLVRGVSMTTIRREAQANRTPVAVKVVPLVVAPPREDIPVLFGHHRAAVLAASASWWTPPASNGPTDPAPSPQRAVCDLCHKPFTDGQSTADAVICASCIKKGER